LPSKNSVVAEQLEVLHGVPPFLEFFLSIFPSSPVLLSLLSGLGMLFTNCSFKSWITSFVRGSLDTPRPSDSHLLAPFLITAPSLNHSPPQLRFFQGFPGSIPFGLQVTILRTSTPPKLGHQHSLAFFLQRTFFPHTDPNPASCCSFS